MSLEGGNLGKGCRFPVIVLINVKITQNKGIKLCGQAVERILKNIF